MKIDIMTLFPEMINAVMRESIIGRAQDKGVIAHNRVDDARQAPQGG